MPFVRSNVFLVYVDGSLSSGIDEGKLVWCYSDNLAVLIMKLFESTRKIAIQLGADMGKPKCSP